MTERTGVWVTGGAGFLGSHIAEALVAGGEAVTVVDDFSTGREENVPTGAAVVGMGLEDDGFAEALGRARPGIVYHLAGDARVGRSVADPRTDCERNLLATLALLEAVRRGSPETKVLFASTGAVYGSRAERPFREEDAVRPASPYAVSKLAAERYCDAYAQTYGLRTCSLRLFSVYGPRQRKQVVYDLIGKMRTNPAEVELFGSGGEERDFSHVANVVEAFLLAAERAPFAGEVYNVAGEEIVTIRGLAERLARTMGVAPRLRFSGAARPGDAERWVADTGRLRALGYTPRVRLDDGLRDTVEWVLGGER